MKRAGRILPVREALPGNGLVGEWHELVRGLGSTQLYYASSALVGRLLYLVERYAPLDKAQDAMRAAAEDGKRHA